MNRTLTLAAMFVCSTLLVSPANAWMITQAEPAPGTGLAESLVLPYDRDPGVDEFEIHKCFLYDGQPLLLTFTRQDGDQDTLEIVDEIILNMFTAQQRAWANYHVLLEKDPVTGKEVAFIDPGQATARQASGGPTRLGGAPVSATATRIDWVTADPNEYVPYGSFSDAPDNQLVLRGLVIDVSALATGDSFRLKQWPTTTPEPTIVALLYAGFALLALRRHERGR
jgi:hypothetical protein